MEVLGKFIFPSSRETKPLQPLSPERVNAARPASVVSSITTTTKTAEESEPLEVQPSPQSSPIRRAKADLFADYHPTNGSPKALTAFGVPQSPSLPELHALRSHVRTNSDVQGLVKRFEHLDVRDRDAESSERRKKHEAELRRAQIAREEAESDVKNLRAELRQLQKEAEEGRERERKVGKRLEVVMEDFATAKESHASQATVYEKELRKARKEAFKTSSTVLKLQEELKSTRNTLRITQTGFDLERQKAQRKEQERFEMEYQLIPMQEQVEKLTQRLRTVEAEKEALKQTVQEEEIARIAAEGMIALPASQDQDDDLMSSPRKGSPRKYAQSPLSDDKENVHIIPKKAFDNRRLAEELARERRQRELAEELADFLRLECMFRCCQCQSGRRLTHGLRLSFDAELAAGVDTIRQDMLSILTPPSTAEADPMEFDAIKVEEVTVEEVVYLKPEHSSKDSDVQRESEKFVAELMDRSLTLAAESPATYPSPDDQLREEAEQALIATTPTPQPELCKNSTIERTVTIPLQLSSPLTPSYQEHHTTPFRQQTSIRTITTTTSIPMHFTPVPKPQPFFNSTNTQAAENHQPEQDSAIDDSAVPSTPTFDRAAALAAIEYRRGRAKSIANGHATPRKQMIEGIKERRDISAPALGQKIGQGSVKSRSGSANRSGGKR